jgi:hypothetical protein
MNLELFAREFLEDILSLAQASEDGEYQENVFTETAIGYLAQVGECFDPQIAYYSAKGSKLNAWEYNYDNDTVDLFVSVFDNSAPVAKMSKGLLMDSFRRCRKFLELSLGGLHRGIEESSKAFEVAQTIHSMKSEIESVRVFLLTNCVAFSDKIENTVVGTIKVEHHVWDVERFFQTFAGSGGREPIELDISSLGGGLPCVKLLDDNEVYDSFVGMIPGTVLAGLYGKWGQRLLEQNVRAYLQARGNVNKGIIKTIAETPHMFLAYNNGISTTAESVELLKDDGSSQLKIARMKNFQIVNGGQTTASLYHAVKKNRADLSKVQILFKLTVLKDASKLAEHVPLISRYANTQTKVNVSDFSANDPYHLELERQSRSVWVPNPDSRGKSTSKWYYERARGQYINDMIMEGTPSKMAAFKLQYPKNQILTKTTVAKFEMSWRQCPHYVSQGAETNFIHFMNEVVGEQVGFKPDETYFKRIVAEAILFKECDDLVKEKELGGYKANVVTYSVALLSFLTAMRINRDQIWQAQGVGSGVRNALSRIADVVWAHINSPPKEGMNIGSYCKREYCWTSLRDRDHNLDALAISTMQAELLANGPPSPSSLRDTLSEDDERMIAEALLNPEKVWKRLSRWGAQTKVLEGWERSLAYSIGEYVRKKRKISPKQAKQGLRVLSLAVQKGFKKDQAD